ncbi:MAG: formimidoylglutamate deiminase [Rhodobacteraceae bacterium]|nr:formimidoylglutamate deiminase [Paracoccaceae bacterium]
MKKIWAAQALIGKGWVRNVCLSIEDGHISAIEEDVPQGNVDGFGALIPAPTNLHSHSFQRAMAGMTENKGPDPRDSFWSWRKLMFKFLNHLSPKDIQTITEFVQMEMLEAGYASVCEFHYLHHQADGRPYGNIAETSDCIAAATSTTGIGLTHLPVLYQYGGCDKRGLGAGQIRFGNTFDQYAELVTQAGSILSDLPKDCRLGVAPHSLRAVDKDDIARIAALRQNEPIHMHLAEQIPEVEEVLAAYGARPVTWLLDNHDIDKRWCLIHMTQMTASETVSVAKTGAVAGLCPMTEASLGDGIFDGIQYHDAGGQFGIGSDSNIRISLSEELRLLEYSQRLRDKGRALFAEPERSTGRVLIDSITTAGAQAAGRNAGSLEVGKLADIASLDMSSPDLAAKTGDMILDTFIFAGSDVMVTDVWSAGRHVVKQGQHIQHESICNEYRKTMKSILGRL